MIIFLDTNILVELIERRNNSDKVFVVLDKCRELGNCLYMSVGGFYTITYLVDRHLKQEGMNNPERLKELKSILKYILSICNISSLDKEGIMSCLNNDDFVDLEDGYQFQSALYCGADLLLTINKKDFIHADQTLIKVLTPDEYLETYID